MLATVQTKDAAQKESWRKKGTELFRGKTPKSMEAARDDALVLRRQSRRSIILRAQRARLDMRGWAVKRRERTRHLIELGGLVMKAGLVELSRDDRTSLYGAFLDLADTLKRETREPMMAPRRRRGGRALVGGRGAGAGQT